MRTIERARTLSDLGAAAVILGSALFTNDDVIAPVRRDSGRRR